MKTNKLCDLMGWIGGFNFYTTFELDGCFFEEKVSKSIGNNDGTIGRIGCQNVRGGWNVVLLIAIATTGTGNGGSNELNGKVNIGTVKSKVMKCSLAGKSKTSTSLHVNVVNVAFWFQDFFCFRLNARGSLFGLNCSSTFVTRGNHVDLSWLSEDCTHLVGKI